MLDDSSGYLDKTMAGVKMLKSGDSEGTVLHGRDRGRKQTIRSVGRRLHLRAQTRKPWTCDVSSYQGRTSGAQQGERDFVSSQVETRNCEDAREMEFKYWASH